MSYYAQTFIEVLPSITKGLVSVTDLTDVDLVSNLLGKIKEFTISNVNISDGLPKMDTSLDISFRHSAEEVFKALQMKSSL